MQLHQFPPSARKSKKRVGRGYGSGRGGHTSSRGAKGTKARSRVGILFAGTKVKKSLIQRLPKLRGRGKFNPFNLNRVTLGLDEIVDRHPANQVSYDSLVEAGLIKLHKSISHPHQVKIVSGQKKCPKTFIGLTLSRQAAKHVAQTGGKVSPTR